MVRKDSGPACIVQCALQAAPWPPHGGPKCQADAPDHPHVPRSFAAQCGGPFGKYVFGYTETQLVRGWEVSAAKITASEAPDDRETYRQIVGQKGYHM